MCDLITMSYRRSRKLLPLLRMHFTNTTGLNVNFTVFYVKFSICHISNSFREIFENLLSLKEFRNCALVTRSSLGSVSFT